jgi:hypothetical protein
MLVLVAGKEFTGPHRTTNKKGSVYPLPARCIEHLFALSRIASRQFAEDSAPVLPGAPLEFARQCLPVAVNWQEDRVGG